MKYYKRTITGMARALLIPITIFLLLQGEIAFGAGDRFLGTAVAAHQQGLIIKQVLPGSPATKVVDTSNGQYMSLKPGDIIQSVNGVTIRNPANLGQLLRQGPPIAIIRVWDIYNNLFRIIAAGVGSPNEIAAYLNQRSQNLKNNRADIIPPTPAPPHTPTTYGMSAAQRRAKIQALDARIRTLNRKIMDQKRSIQQYENWGDERPGATNLMLQNSARNLLQTYERQKMNLEMQKAKLESGGNF